MPSFFFDAPEQRIFVTLGISSIQDGHEHGCDHVYRGARQTQHRSHPRNLFRIEFSNHEIAHHGLVPEINKPAISANECAESVNRSQVKLLETSGHAKTQRGADSPIQRNTIHANNRIQMRRTIFFADFNNLIVPTTRIQKKKMFSFQKKSAF